jgi:hypothetical protein
MDTTLNWLPSLYGDLLEPMPKVEELIDCEARPMPEDSAWIKKQLERELAQAPDYEEVLWDSVLMIWRLKMLEKFLEGDETEFQEEWANHLEAWLVSNAVGKSG